MTQFIVSVLRCHQIYTLPRAHYLLQWMISSHLGIGPIDIKSFQNTIAICWRGVDQTNVLRFFADLQFRLAHDTDVRVHKAGKEAISNHWHIQKWITLLDVGSTFWILSIFAADCIQVTTSWDSFATESWGYSSQRCCCCCCCYYYYYYYCHYY